MRSFEKSYKRSPSAPQLAMMDIAVPAKIRKLLQRGWNRARNTRHWAGWRHVLRGSILLVILALVALVAKLTVYPTSNPREDWVPAAWGIPWYTNANSWSNIAARRKVVLREQAQAGLSFHVPSTVKGSGNKPARLRYPVLWAAPFFSRSGYGTEAISYIAGLLEHGLVAPEDLWITQAGDGRHPDALDGLDPSIRQLLWDQEWHNITRRLSPEDRDRPLVVVCHVFPDCWRTEHDDKHSRWAVVRFVKWFVTDIKIRLWGLDANRDNGCPCPNVYIKDRVVYRVGRSMFETELLPAPLVACADQLDEVLVPSRFSVDSFAASGIPAAKLQILAQGINTTLFDPSQHSPVNLASLEGKQVTGYAHPYTQPTDIAAAATGRRRTLDHVDATLDHMDAKTAETAEAKVGSVAAVQTVELSGAKSGSQQSLRIDVSGGQGAVHAHQSMGAKGRTLEEVAVAGREGAKVPATRAEPFRFLSVFKWEARKGWDILLRAYFQEFSPMLDNVELHVVTHAFGFEISDFRDFMRYEIMKLINVTEEHLDTRLPRVYVYDKYIPDSTYPGLYQAMDALVVPTHGEGWGRPQFEAMSMGIPVISTNWSGITAFMDDTVGYPIHVEALVEVVDNSPDAFVWFKGQRWAQPSLSHLQQLMRDVINNRKQAAIKGQAARKRIQEEFSILAVARKALTEINRIQTAVDTIMNPGGGVMHLPV